MQDKHKKKIALRIRPPKTVQVNRPLVLVSLGILALIIILAIVSAFHISSRKTENEVVSGNIADVTDTVDAKIKQLPSSYSDTSAMQRYLGKSSANISNSLQKQLVMLKQQQAELQDQLAELNQQRIQEQERSSIQMQQAKSSSLFFSGEAPLHQNAALAEQAKIETKSQTSDQAANKLSSYQQQNMQHQKIKFLRESEAEDESAIYNKHILVKPLSPYEVQAGTLIPAVLITAINTSLPGEAVAQVQDDVYDSVTGKYLLIPKGSKIIGQYDSQISYGQARVLIAFNRIIRPDGSSILLGKLSGTDLWGTAGMHGNVNNHWGKVFSAAILSTLLSVGAGVAADSAPNTDTYYRSAGQNALLGGAGGIAQTGQNIVNRSLDVQPTLSIPTGYQFNIIVNKDIILEPYQKWGINK